MSSNGERVDVEVFELNDAIVTFRLKRKLPGGTFKPYLLDGAPSIEYFGKNAKGDTDASAVMKYSIALGQISIIDDGTAPSSEYSVVEVRYVGSDLAPGEYWHRLDVIKASKRQTVLHGVLTVVNV